MKFEVKVEEFLRNITDVDNRLMQATRLYAETAAAQKVRLYGRGRYGMRLLSAVLQTHSRSEVCLQPAQCA